jgi:hypothetical protein
VPGPDEKKDDEEKKEAAEETSPSTGFKGQALRPGIKRPGLKRPGLKGVAPRIDYVLCVSSPFGLHRTPLAQYCNGSSTLGSML